VGDPQPGRQGPHQRVRQRARDQGPMLTFQNIFGKDFAKISMLTVKK
jgi:hypothetical protein